MMRFECRSYCRFFGMCVVAALGSRTTHAEQQPYHFHHPILLHNPSRISSLAHHHHHHSPSCRIVMHLRDSCIQTSQLLRGGDDDDANQLPHGKEQLQQPTYLNERYIGEPHYPPDAPLHPIVSGPSQQRMAASMSQTTWAEYPPYPDAQQQYYHQSDTRLANAAGVDEMMGAPSMWDQEQEQQVLLEHGDAYRFETPPPFMMADPIYGTSDSIATVQERLEAWRETQRQYATDMQKTRQNELLTTAITKRHTVIIFAVMLFRYIHFFDVIEQIRGKSGPGRLLLVIPVTALFLLNMAGATVSLGAPPHSKRKRLKVILNVDKFVEIVLILYYLLRVTIFPSLKTPFEIYFNSMIVSAFFVIMFQSYTRLCWGADLPSLDDTVAQSQSTTSFTN